jgi:DNA-binding NarL/FixJ family response regulator
MMNNELHLSVLLADDHQMIVDGIKSMLAFEPSVSVAGEATNGQQAFNMISAEPEKYNVLLTDISMPLLSGIELCRMVKKQFPAIQVLMLSMYNSTAAVRESLLAEADGYILKSAGKDELLTALHRISEGGTYFSDDILPIIYNQYQKEKTQEARLANLSPREKEVLSLIVKEHTSTEIAEKLFISKKTVDNHRQNILDKCDCKTTIGLVKFALNNGLAQ